jgi:type VI secretion system secreted protein Hcp
MRRAIFAAAIPSLALAFVFAGAARAADPIYMQVTGEKSGPIQGGVTLKGLEGSMHVLALSHEIDSPRDAATGQATGKRQHKPLVITMVLDKSTPLLLNAMVTDEVLKEVHLLFYERGAKGNLVNTFDIKLTNAQISHVATVYPDTGSPRSDRPVLQLSFVYQKIEWTWVEGAVTAADDWQAQG